MQLLPSLETVAVRRQTKGYLNTGDKFIEGWMVGSPFSLMDWGENVSARMTRLEDYSYIPVSTGLNLLTVKCPKLCFLWWASSRCLSRAPDVGMVGAKAMGQEPMRINITTEAQAVVKAGNPWLCFSEWSTIS
ncbi:unnamed protein product [Dovyalis caffra]|uniref:Uncharacterized protein n=1 Tax=Dovyalis caffra TaxID=77055 RepID=A0AAV1S4N6_9ROSI|nr:unnamed protein product [Dovyalis caffra]